MLSSKPPSASSASFWNTPRKTVSASPADDSARWKVEPPSPSRVVYAVATACSKAVVPRASITPPTLAAPVSASNSTARAI